MPGAASATRVQSKRDAIIGDRSRKPSRYRRPSRCSAVSICVSRVQAS
jgi:hypothetical protein